VDLSLNGAKFVSGTWNYRYQGKGQRSAFIDDLGGTEIGSWQSDQDPSVRGFWKYHNAGMAILYVDSDLNGKLDDKRDLYLGWVSVKEAMTKSGEDGGKWNRLTLAMGIGKSNEWSNFQIDGSTLYIYGTSENDTLVGTRTNDSCDGGRGNDIICGESGVDYLYGGTGNDKLYGGNGTDFLTGISSGYSPSDQDTTYGKGQIDILTGGSDNDTFLLSGTLHNQKKAPIFYQDGSTKSSGRTDYAWITDFTKGDKIQLKGKSTDYQIKKENFTIDKKVYSGFGLYFDDGSKKGSWDSTDELIGFIQTTNKLALTNSSMVASQGFFSYV